MRSSRERRDGSHRTRGKSVDGSDSDQKSDSPPRRRRPGREGRRRRRAGLGKSLRQLADMYDTPTKGADEREDSEHEERFREDSERETRGRQNQTPNDRDDEEQVSEQSYEEPASDASVDNTYQEKIRILNKIENIRQQRQRLKDQMREWNREFCDDERHPLDNYRERDYIDALPEDSKRAYEDYKEVKDNIEDLEKKLERLDVRLRRLRDEKEAEAEGYEDLFKSTRHELLRVKEKRDEVLVKLKEELQEEREGNGERKMIEHESHEIEEAIRECQEDVDLINQYDVDLETRSLMSLQEMASNLDRDIEVLQAQSKNAVEEERRYESQRKKVQADADMYCEKLDILRRKEEKVIVKSRDILKEFRAAFNPLAYAKIAQAENSRPKRSIVSGLFSRKQAPMSNEKFDHCRRSIRNIEETLRAIRNDLQPRRNDDEDDSESDDENDFNAELRSLIIHLLTKAGSLMMEFNELLQREHDFGDDRLYTVMHAMEESFEYENEIEMIKANADSTEFSRTLKRLKALKKLNQQLKDERKFRKQSMKKFQDSQSKYRRTCRDQNDQIKKINEYESENKEMSEQVEYLKENLENITTQLGRRHSQLKGAKNLVWSSVRNVGSDKRGQVRSRNKYAEEQKYNDYNPSDSDDAESLREHALQEIDRWSDEDIQGRSRRAEPSRYPRSGGRDSYDASVRDSYNTPGGYKSSKKNSSPKGRRSRSPRRRDSPQRVTPGYDDYDEYDNKCEDPPSGVTPGVYRDGSRRSRSMRTSTSPERSPRPYHTKGASVSPSPPLER